MKYLYSLVSMVWLIGCGNASEPPITKPLEIKKEQPQVDKTDTNNTTTHIRVLAKDTKSSIPEYLVKLPIHIN